MSAAALFDLESLYYASLTEATHCRDCRRPIAPRHTRCAEGVRPEGFFVLCDDCVLSERDAA